MLSFQKFEYVKRNTKNIHSIFDHLVTRRALLSFAGKNFFYSIFIDILQNIEAKRILN